MRYFLEVAYKGTLYSGFQKQLNASTIQGEIEKAFTTIFKKDIQLTGSSRTDAGVHALQNFFHFDWAENFPQPSIYNLNALLPADIVIKNVLLVNNDAHCRFDAISRLYNYHISQHKNPFVNDTAYYYPYSLNIDKLNNAASLLNDFTDFTSFSKKNTQVKTFNCEIIQSKWIRQDGLIIYRVEANRFLRGMVRALTATMLQVGRGKISSDDFRFIIESKNCSNAYFSVPARGLTLSRVKY